MATSTRRKAIDLWGPKLPAGDPYKLAKALFCYDNPPGTREISGAQDTIGIVFPGLARSDYDGEYWPHHIEHVTDEDTLQFVQDHVFLAPLGPRAQNFAVLSNTHIDSSNAQRLAEAADACWDAIMRRDLSGFGTAVRESFEAQIAMFPNMCTSIVRELVDFYQGKASGWKLSGAGGGGYLVVIACTTHAQEIHCCVRCQHS